MKVTDFGLAAVSEEGARRNSLVGTIEYMCACPPALGSGCAALSPASRSPVLALVPLRAPEIVTGRGHSKAADWWSLGVLTFEMLTGSAPFRAKNRSLLQKKILSEKPVLPKFLSHPANRLLNSLLCRDEAKRLGGGPHGSADVRAHPFFDGVNWAKLGAGQVEAPFKPSVQGALCTANFDAETTRRPAHDSPAATPDGDRGRTAFAGYSYNREQPGLAQRHDRGAAAASAARQGDNQGKGGGAAPGDP